MNFADLHEQLRLELVRRIDTQDLTGSRLAQMTGFRQAHISNFLNRKRALSLEGLDRVLASQNLTIPEILCSDTVQLQASASALPGQQDSLDIQPIPLVPPSVAIAAPDIPAHSILETIPVAASHLCENRTRTAPGRTRWQRFVAIRADARHVATMEPLITDGAIIILDRHYTSLALYRVQQPNLYAVHHTGSLHLGFASFDDNRLILRPNSTAFPIQLIPIPPNQSPSDLIVGRACLVLNTL